MDWSVRSADQIGVEPIDRLDREGFDFVVDDRASCLAKAREDSFHNHLVAFPNFDLTETDDFQRAGLILQQKPIGWFTLPIGGELDVGDLAGYHHFLAVVLLGMGEEFSDLQETRCVGKPWYRDEGEQGEYKNQEARGSIMLKRWLDAGQSGHDVDVLYLTGGKVQSRMLPTTYRRLCRSHPPLSYC
jgi:hypothetical protein